MDNGLNRNPDVSHEGGDNAGSYFWTLNATDIYSSWNSAVLIKSKSQDDVLIGLKILIETLPFPLKGIDSENGIEFINQLILDFCTENNILFTRCRPYKKNDNCYVEQKNYSVVRRNVGYLRYDSPEEFELITSLYIHMNQYNNLFQPVKKQISKARIGTKTIKKFDIAKTPYQRLMETDIVDLSIQEQLLSLYECSNPAALKRKINAIQDQVIELSKNKKQYSNNKQNKKELHNMARFRKRSKPSKRNPSTFVEKQTEGKLRDTMNILDQLREEYRKDSKE